MAWLSERTSGRGVVEVRGRGLMIGVALSGGSARALAVTRTLLERGWIVLTGGPQGDVLTLTPPLDVDESLLEAFAGELAARAIRVRRCAPRPACVSSAGPRRGSPR